MPAIVASSARRSPGVPRRHRPAAPRRPARSPRAATAGSLPDPSPARAPGPGPPGGRRSVMRCRSRPQSADLVGRSGGPLRASFGLPATADRGPRTGQSAAVPHSSTSATTSSTGMAPTSRAGVGPAGARATRPGRRRTWRRRRRRRSRRCAGGDGRPAARRPGLDRPAGPAGPGTPSLAGHGRARPTRFRPRGRVGDRRAPSAGTRHRWAHPSPPAPRASRHGSGWPPRRRAGAAAARRRVALSVPASTRPPCGRRRGASSSP
jgi:hypothetical protein